MRRDEFVAGFLAGFVFALLLVGALISFVEWVA